MPANRIPDSIIESVKANTPILSLLRKYGVRTEKKGRSYMAVCPFHHDTQASLSIDRTQNLFHCLGCDAAGNVIQFVERMEKVGFPQAVDKLLALKGLPRMPEVDPSVSSEKEDGKQPELSPEERNTILQHIVNQSVENLRNSQEARSYLARRGLDPLGLLDCYTVGFHNGSVFKKLAEAQRAKLEAVGLTREGRSLFDGCVMFPLRKNGTITTIYGRKAEGEGTHYLLPCKREGLYLPKNGLNPREPVVITESIIDGLSLFAAGIRNVLPLLGVNGFLPDHLAYLKTQAFPKIIIALDGDEAGNRAAAQLCSTLAANGLCAEVVQLPEGMDINDMLRQMGAQGLYQWFTERTTDPAEDEPTVSEDDDYLYVLYDTREYRIRFPNPQSMESMKVNIKVYDLNNRSSFYIDTLDLYQHRGRGAFISQTTKLFGLEREKIAEEVNTIITILEEHRLDLRKRRESQDVYTMTEEERTTALQYLSGPKLLERIAADFEQWGMVGNMKICLLSYLLSLSRLLDKALGGLIVSRSSAGKSYTQDMISSFAPDESVCKVTRMTGQSLFYQGRTGLKHKFLNIEEAEGMRDSLYAIRTLLSSQRLQVFSVGRDAKDNQIKSFENVVEGPVSVLISTTDQSIFDRETLSRFFVMHLDESAEQTRKIMEYHHQMAGLEGLRRREPRRDIEQLHRNIQRLLKPMAVVNPHGCGVKYPAEIINARREMQKLDTLIKTMALLHQYQRPVKEETLFGTTIRYIEVTQEDVDAVWDLAGDVLRQSIDDELSTLGRELLQHVHGLVGELYERERKQEPDLRRWQVVFTRKDVRDRCRWSRWHVDKYLFELTEAGYITPRIGKKGQKYSYSLVEERIPDMPAVDRSV